MMEEEKEQYKKEETVKGAAGQPAEPGRQKTAETKHHHIHHKNGGQEKDEQIKELQEKLAAAIKEKDEIFARLQRVSADYANYQNRSHKQTTETVCFEREKLIKSILPAIDDLEHIVKNASASPTEPIVFISGIKIVYDHILDILKACGVEQIQAAGEKFDPFLHEAISQAQDAGKEDNIVLEENQKGYKVEGRVIRPSKVIVNKLSKTEPAKDEKVKPSEEQENQQDESTDVEQ